MKKILIVLCAWVILAAGACSAATSTSKAPPNQIQAAALLVNSISGSVDNLEDIWPKKEIILFAAIFTGTSEKEGYFVLEPDQNPHTTVGQKGSFTLSDLPPGQYILLAGPTPEEARKLFAENGEPTILKIEEGQQIDIGSTFLPE